TDDSAEREAEAVANRITGAQPAEAPRLASQPARGYLRRQPNPDDQPKKDPPPVIPLPHPLDKLDPKLCLPSLGCGSLEDLNQVLHPPSSGQSKDMTCAPGWRMLKTGMCCPGSTVNPEQCCPPIRLTNLGVCCPTDQYADGINCVKPNFTIPIKPPGGPPPVTPHPGSGQGQDQGGVNPNFKPMLPPTPPLTVTLPIYFQQDKPKSTVADEKNLQASL